MLSPSATALSLCLSLHLHDATAQHHRRRFTLCYGHRDTDLTNFSQPCRLHLLLAAAEVEKKKKTISSSIGSKGLEENPKLN